MPSYKVDNQIYDIPEDKVDAFEQQYPEALVSYSDNGSIYDIPANKRSAFETQFPNAQRLGWDDEQTSGSLSTMQEEPNEIEPVRGFLGGARESWKGLKAGMQNLYGETVNAFTGSSKDGVKALYELDNMVSQGKDVTEEVEKGWSLAGRELRTGALELLPGWMIKGWKDRVHSEADKSRVLEDIKDALAEAGGDVNRARQILVERSKQQTYGDSQIEKAAEQFADVKPTEGFGAWVGSNAVQMIPSASALIIGAATKSPTIAKAIGTIGMGAMTAATAGSSMHEARQAGASDHKTWKVGITDGMIEYLTEKLPFDRWTSRIVGNVKGEVAKELFDALQTPGGSARKDLERLLIDANERLGGKLFTKRTLKQYIGDMIAEGASEFSAEALQTMTSMMYEQPENYPTISEILSNGWEGAKAGFFMGAVLGGASLTMEHNQHRKRRMEKGSVDVAQVNTGDGETEVVEVVDYDTKTNKAVILKDGQFEQIDGSDIVQGYRFSFEEFEKARLREMEDEAIASGNVSDGQVAGMEDVVAQDLDKVRSLASDLTESEITSLLSGEATAQAGTPLAEAVEQYRKDVQRLDDLRTSQTEAHEAKKNAVRDEIEKAVGQRFWMQESGEADPETGIAPAAETVEEIVYADGKVGYVVGYDDAGNLTMVYNDGTHGFTSRSEVTEKLNSGEIVSDTPMDLDAYLESKMAQEKQAAEQTRMAQEYQINVEEMIATHPIGSTINVGTEEAPVEVQIIATSKDGAIVQMPDGTTPMLRWEDVAHAGKKEVVPQTDAQREQSIIDQYRVVYAPVEEAIDEVEQEIKRQSPAKDYPRKADGSVDQVALWNEDPAGWAQWNDQQRKDGGANSLEYITNAIATEQAALAQMQEAYRVETDFDARDAMEQQINAKAARLQTLAGLQQQYVAAQEQQAAQQEEQIQQPQAAPTTEEEIAAEEQRRQPLRQRAKELSEKLGVKVNIAETLADVKEKRARMQIMMADVMGSGKRVPGWYNVETGEVTIYLPHVLSTKDVDKTYVHEVVSHKGLRELLGEEGFNVLCDSVWEIMTPEEKQAFINYPGVGGDTRKAADEYMAYISESLDLEEFRPIWDRIVSFVEKILLSMGVKLNLGRHELAGIIAESYNRLQKEAEKAVTSQPNVTANEQQQGNIENGTAGQSIGDLGQSVEAVGEEPAAGSAGADLAGEQGTPGGEPEGDRTPNPAAEDQQSVVEPVADSNGVTPEQNRDINTAVGGAIESADGNDDPVRFSVTAIADGAGLELIKDDGKGNVAIVLPDGRVFNADNLLKPEDVSSIPNTVLGYMMKDARSLGTVNKAKEWMLWNKYTAMLNAILTKGSAANGGYEYLESQWQWVADTIYKTVAINSDSQYSFSLDITRVCKKNEAVINAISEMQARLGYGITPGQIMDIYMSTIEEGYQVPCPVCYVFSRYIRNGKYATIMINGQRKYGSKLVDPRTLTEAQKKEKIQYWLRELKKIKDQNKANSKEIAKANSDITTLLDEIDAISKQLTDPQSGLTEQQKEEMRDKIYELDARYKAALNVVSQSSLDSWITQFAIYKKKVGGKEQWTLFDDSYMGFPEEMALDIRQTSTVMRKYPAIQRFRNSRGAAAGKEITFVANNDLGDVPLALGSAGATKDLAKPREMSDEEWNEIKTQEYAELKLGVKNLYRQATEEKDPKKKKKLLEAAKRRFTAASIYAKQQSLRGGQRMWSWSDNIERLAPDVFVNLLQLEMLGGALQSYSKQLEGIKLVASMNGYVNGSLMGKGNGYREVTEAEIEEVDGKQYLKDGDFIVAEPGKKPFVLKTPVYKHTDGKYYVLEFDDVVGIDPFGKEVDGKHMKGLFELNSEYDRAGNIIVGMNDLHIRMCMADDRIFFIIPWHSSGANSHILAQMYEYLGVEYDVKQSQDYTDVQSEKRYKAPSETEEETDEAEESSEDDEKKKESNSITQHVVDFWDDHYENAREYPGYGMVAGKDFACGIEGGVESSDGNGNLSASQMHYRELRDAIFLGVTVETGELDKDGKPKKKVVDVEDYSAEWFNEIMSDEFLSQVYNKVREVAGDKGMTSKDSKAIYPYEYWDESSTYETADINGARYMEYCRRLGYKPKFCGKLDGNPAADHGNFTDDRGYWKVLIDRRMYAISGDFQDLTPVTAENFTPDLVDPEKTKEEFVVTRVADEQGTKTIVDKAIATEQSRPGGIATVDYGMSLQDALDVYNGKKPAKPEAKKNTKPVDLVKEAKKANASNIAFRFVGEMAARNVDALTDANAMMDALYMARDMETQLKPKWSQKRNKAAQKIKMATGWEKGVDGLWRYEMPDFIYKAKPGKKSFTLGELIEDKSLFKEYPVLKDASVVFIPMEEGDYGYLEKTDEGYNIKINDKFYYRINPEWNAAMERLGTDYPESLLRIQAENATDADIDLLDQYTEGLKEFNYAELGGREILAHEIQHAIQDMEGFAEGGSAMTYDTHDPAAAKLETRRKHEIAESKRLQGEYRDIQKQIKFMRFLNDSKTEAQLMDKAAKISDEFNMHQQNLRDVIRGLELYGRIGNEGYKNLAGEVESKNVETRLDMTPEQRRESLIADTQDVDHENQTILRNGLMVDYPDLENVSFRVTPEEDDIRFRVSVANTKTGESDVSTGEMEVDLMFRMTNNTRQTVSNWLNKRQDLSEEVKNAILDYLDQYNDTTLQLAMGKWYARNEIRLPEDGEKCMQAVAAAKKAKVDPMQFSSPMEIINQYGIVKSKREPIDPDTVPTLKKVRELEGGLVIYDVEDSEESRKNMREIINTHYGENCSPWCLLQGDENGNLTEQAAEYWKMYSAYGKQVAFKDGKLLAFCANSTSSRVWWSRMDKPYNGIPVQQKLEDGRTAVMVYDEKSGKQIGITDISRTKKDGEYTHITNWATVDGPVVMSQRLKGQELVASYERYNKADYTAIEYLMMGRPSGIFNVTDMETQKSITLSPSGKLDSYTDGAYRVSYNKDKWQIDARTSDTEYVLYIVDRNGKLVEYYSKETGIVKDKNELQDIEVPEAVMAIVKRGRDGYQAEVEELLRSTGLVDDEDISFRMVNENQAIFVSNAARAVEGIKQEKATPEQWLNMLEKNGGLKAGEDKWMGLSDWLKASDKKTLTKDEVLDFINEHMIIIEEQEYAFLDQEVVEQEAYKNLIEKYGEDFVKRFVGPAFIYEEGFRGPYIAINDPIEAKDLYYEETGKEIRLTENGDLTYPDQAALVKWAETVMREAEHIDGVRSTERRRRHYVTKNLDNYHEIALTVPAIHPWNTDDVTHFGDAGNGRAVVWIRFGETTTKNGEKVLVIDEVQSKRHDTGRKKGYADVRVEKQIDAAFKEYEQKNAELNEYYKFLDEKYGVPTTLKSPYATKEEIKKLKQLRKEAKEAHSRWMDARSQKGAYGIPDAPFEKNWHELAMKRMLRYAAENGFDYIAWTLGEQQRERYNLAKLITSVGVNVPTNSTGRAVSLHYKGEEGPDYFYMEIDEAGKVKGGHAKGRKLSEVVGKAIADQIMEVEDSAKIEAKDLRVGGEGLADLYDKMLPTIMTKYGKQWGVKVSDIELPNAGESGLTMHSIPVTEEMKEAVMEGQVMFRTSMDLDQEFGDAWRDQQNEDGRHSTQVANTKSTYEKIGSWMKEAGLEGASILDASSGLGLGTQALREMGFQVDDVEPFPSENREAPTFGSYDDIDGKYDVVISNAVLNVIPDDWRADVLHKMAAVVKDGGKIIINTRPASNISKQGVEGKTRITLDSPSEILVKRGDRIAAYQKGFTSEELADWIKSELGEGWRVEKATKKNSGISGEGTAVVIKEGDDVSFRTVGTPTEQIVAEGVNFSKKDLASLAGEIFAALPEESRRKITDRLNGNLLGLQDAIMQIPTDLAVKEEWSEEDQKVAGAVAEAMTNAVGVEMTRPFSASEALWTLYNATHKSTDLVTEASRALVMRNLGFGPQVQEQYNQAEEDVRFRTVGDASINASASLYNKGAVNVWTRLKESFVDMNAAIEELVKSIVDKTGKEVQGFEDILKALNQQPSKGLAAVEDYVMKFLNPMLDEVKRIMRKTKKSYQDVVRYVILKHGLERNEKLAQRDAKAHYQEIYDKILNLVRSMDDAQRADYYGKAQKRMADAKANRDRLKAIDTTNFTAEQKADHKNELAKAIKEVEEAAQHLFGAEKVANMSEMEIERELLDVFKSIENGTNSKYQELRERDYSGISSMFYDQLGVDRSNFATAEEYQAALMAAKQDKYATLADIEAAAKTEVKDFEKAADTSKLWKKINAATKEILRQQYEANMISKDQYDSLRDMFEYYVPLRGFADNTAEDMYTYYRTPNSNGYTKPILGAEGRKTEAESPFGWIAAMAGSAIASNVKNEAKLALYYFVSNRPDNGVATISKTWFVDSGEVDADGKKIFKPAYPPFNEDLSTDSGKAAYEAWQQHMQDLRSKGQAYESGQRLNLGNAVVNISDAHKPEHIVNVKVAGKDYTIVINGNPRAAQAINGDLNIESTASDYSKLFGPMLRWMSSVNTSYNPEFWITNMMRDMLFTWMSVDINGDPAYKRRFRSNYWKAFKVISMVAKNEKGTLGNSYLEDAYKDFVKYGGVTGYTQIKDSETWEKEIDSYLSSSNLEDRKLGGIMSGVKDGFHAIHRFGESLEQVSRFAAFLTARETGKSVEDAIADAKEITVNFNRKGSGKMISLEEAKYLTGKNGRPLNKVQQWMVVGLSSIAPLGRRTIMFFNAAIQGLNSVYRLYQKNPKRLGAWALGYAMIGVMNAVIHALFDDDDDYLDMPQYERRNSLMLGGNGVYFKWALPQEARAFYALGDLAVETIMGRNPHQNVIGEALKIGAEVLPVNPTEGWKAFMPSVAIPFIELGLNEDYKGAPIYNEQVWLSKGEKERTAKWSNAYQNTGMMYIEISKALNNITGGDAHDAGIVNIQPEKMEHLVQSAFGGTVRTVDKFVTTIMAAIDPEEDVAVRQTPFLNRIMTLNDERFKNVHVNEVYNFYAAEAEHALTLEKKYTKDKDKESLQDLRKSDEYRYARIYGKYKKAIEKLQEKIKVADGTAEKQELMKRQDEIKKRMIKEISEL